MKSYTLILTSAGTVYKLDTLIKAINSTERGMFASISIQADIANATNVLIGGSNLSSTVYAVSMDAGDILNVGEAPYNTVSTLGLYAYGVTTAGLKLHISLDER